MFFPQKRITALSLIAGFLLWLGLSPRTAQIAYNGVLMPRCRSERADIAQTIELATRKVSVRSGTRSLAARLHINLESQKLVIYFGGRRSNLEKSWARAQALLATGASVLFFEYTGFGDTEGRASIRTLLDDGLALFDTATRLGHAPANIIIYGESLGTAVATHVARQRQVGGLILQSGFSSLEAQVKEMIPPMRLYPRCLFPKPEISPVENLKRGHPPLLIIHGAQDDIVNVKHAQKLAQAAGAQTELVVLPEGHHADLFTRKDWQEAVSRLIATV